jgi:hypothetical protein
LNNPLTPRNALAAWLYFAVVILVVAAVWLPGYPAWVTGVIAWAACLLLLPRLPAHQLYMVLALAGIGIAGIAWSMARGGSGLIDRDRYLGGSGAYISGYINYFRGKVVGNIG